MSSLHFHLPTNREFEWMKVNTFVFLSLLILLVLYVLEKYCRCEHNPLIKRWASNVLYSILFVMITSCFLLESYYFEQCPLDGQHRHYNNVIMKFTLDMLEKNNIEYCALSGTSLQVARNSTIHPWDHDSDFLILKPDTDEKLSQLMDIIEEYVYQMNVLHSNDENVEFYFVYHTERDLMQIFKKNSFAHSDLWLYAKENIGNKVFVINNDYTNDYASSHLEYDMIFPTKYQAWTAYGKSFRIRVMNDFHKYATDEFGENYMIPYYSRLQCLEILFTHKASNMRYFIYLIINICGIFIGFKFLKFRLKKYIFRINVQATSYEKKPKKNNNTSNNCIIVIFIIINFIIF